MTVLPWLALAGPIEVFIPSSFPLQNSWRLRVFRNDSGTVESATIPGCLARRSFRRRVQGHDEDFSLFGRWQQVQRHLFMVGYLACHTFSWQTGGQSDLKCLRIGATGHEIRVEPCARCDI